MHLYSKYWHAARSYKNLPSTSLWKHRKCSHLWISGIQISIIHNTGKSGRACSGPHKTAGEILKGSDFPASQVLDHTWPGTEARGEALGWATWPLKPPWSEHFRPVLVSYPPSRVKEVWFPRHSNTGNDTLPPCPMSQKKREENPWTNLGTTGGCVGRTSEGD